VTLLICGIVANPIWLRGQSTQPSPVSNALPGPSQEVVSPQPTTAPVSARSFVYRAENSQAIADYEPNPGVVRRMVNDLVMAVTGQQTVSAAWESLVKPSDIVGIKVCANGAPLFGSHPAVVNAIVAGLMDAGIPP